MAVVNMCGDRKLSELIREGAKLHPQGHGRFFSIDDEGQLHTCAFGAALEVCDPDLAIPVTSGVARGTTVWFFKAPLLRQYFGGTVGALVEHPIRHEQTIVEDAVMSLNDAYEWSRENIADWLERAYNL
jgi:hypothetical protein